MQIKGKTFTQYPQRYKFHGAVIVDSQSTDNYDDYYSIQQIGNIFFQFLIVLNAYTVHDIPFN